MTISPDTIRTVIEIVPDWECRDIGPYLTDVVYPFYDGQRAFTLDCLPENKVLLDALAAAAKVLVDELDNYRLDEYQDVTQIFCDEGTREYMVCYSGGHGRANNTLEAIAEFVKGGGFDANQN